MAARKPLVQINGTTQQLPAGDTLIPADLGIDASAAVLAAGTDTSARPTVAQVKDIADTIVTPGAVASPYRLTRVERDNAGALPLTAWIPSQFRTAIRQGTTASIPDCTAYIQKACADAQHIYVPSGLYIVKDRFQIQYKGSMRGENARSTTFKIPSDSVKTAKGIVGMHHLSSFSGIGLAFDQPSTTNRANLIAHPPAIDLVTLGQQVDISDILIERAMIGINGDKSNHGNSTLRNIRCGAFQKGIVSDGCLGWLDIDGWDSWIYGMEQDANLQAIMADGAVVAMDIGQCESIAFGVIKTFQQIINIRAGAASGSLPFGCIASLSLDGNGATLVASAGRVTIGALYSTKNGRLGSSDATCQSIRVNGGAQVDIGAVNIDCNGPIEDVTVSGALSSLSIGAGHVRQHSLSVAWCRCVTGGGRIVLGPGLEINPDQATQARTQPFCTEDAGGILVCHATFPWRSGDSGNCAAFLNAVNPNSRCDRQFGGWSIAVPSGASANQYGAGS